jgi:uncharacterized protein YbjT (DUF2867 family)
MNNHTQKQTLVLGSTGKTGRRVAQRLADKGVPVRAGSRAGNTPFDWEDRSTWPAALEGVDAVYVSFYPDLAVPGSGAAVRALAEQAKAAGVSRLVLLSGRGEEEAQNAEEIVKQAGIDWTIVRCSWFAQNFDEGYFVEPIVAGEMALPVGDVREPFVDVDDVADVAVAALTEPGHAGKLYELTGPRMLTFAEAVAEIAAATGRVIAYVPVTMEEYAAATAEEGIPEDMAELVRYLFTEVLDGRNEYLSHGVREALGREPRDFRDYVRDAAASGIWNGGEAA